MFLFLTGVVQRGVAYVSLCPKEMLTKQMLQIFLCVCKVPKTLIAVLEDFDTSKT